MDNTTILILLLLVWIPCLIFYMKKMESDGQELTKKLEKFGL